MRELILKQIQPVIDKFILGLIEIHTDTQNKFKDAEVEWGKAQKERENLKAQGDENNRKTHDKVEELNVKINELSLSNAEAKKECERYADLCNDVKKDKAEADKKLKEAEADRMVAAETLTIAKKKAQDYEGKLKSLEQDDAKMVEREKKALAKESDNSKKEQTNRREEERLNKKEQELGEREVLTIKNEELVKREVTRLKIKDK